jgi:hypothetical protein
VDECKPLIHDRALVDIAVRPSLSHALTALLNLSASKECQVSICKRGLRLLLGVHSSFLELGRAVQVDSIEPRVESAYGFSD